MAATLKISFSQGYLVTQPALTFFEHSLCQGHQLRVQYNCTLFAVVFLFVIVWLSNKLSILKHTISEYYLSAFSDTNR